MLGLGIALAGVQMDAMVVRSLLVPAVMRLTGRATWWAPGPLRRFHDRFGLSEGEAEPDGPGQADGVEDDREHGREGCREDDRERDKVEARG